MFFAPIEFFGEVEYLYLFFKLADLMFIIIDFLFDFFNSGLGTFYSSFVFEKFFFF